MAGVIRHIQRAELRGQVDFNQFEVVRSRDHVVGYPRRLGQAPACAHGDNIGNALETKADRTLQYVDKMPGHIVPMPACFLRKRLQGADMLGANASVCCTFEPQVAVFGIGTRPVACEICLAKWQQLELRMGAGELQRPFIARGWGLGHGLFPVESAV